MNLYSNPADFILPGANNNKYLLPAYKKLYQSIRKNDKDDTSKNQEFASLQKLYEFLCVEFGVHCNLHELSEKLTKADIQSWIDENRIEVKEVEKGGVNKKIEARLKELSDRITILRNRQNKNSFRQSFNQ